VKARYLFAPACRRNIRRIEALEEPMLWQFYRLRFICVLIFMSVTAGRLSHMAHGNYPFVLVMGALDLSIGISLLGSSHVFIRRRRPGRTLSAR
jgi:hypothetical protein